MTLPVRSLIGNSLAASSTNCLCYTQDVAGYNNNDGNDDDNGNGNGLRPRTAARESESKSARERSVGQLLLVQAQWC